MKVTKTQISKTSTGQIQIVHSQSIRQSHEYQSADCTYGITLTVDDNPMAIKKGVKKAELYVEKHIIPKVREHRIVLRDLAAKNR